LQSIAFMDNLIPGALFSLLWLLIDKPVDTAPR
jgi:hypothetical protein